MARLVLAWLLALFFIVVLMVNTGPLRGTEPLPQILIVVVLALVITGAFSHLRRVRLIAGHVDLATLGNRQRRQIELPFEAGEAFDMLDATIRELPHTEEVESARDSLQVRAKVRRPNPYGRAVLGWLNPYSWLGSRRNQIFATVTPGDGIGSVMLVCEPESGAWTDWFRVDDGTNLVNAEAITRALARRVAERRRREQQAATQAATDKELAQARLSLLHAQVEPHFLYNTLTSAQYLTRTEPAQADRMLGHLIQYLRHSLPSAEETLSTLGEELERARAYLEILKIRMGARLEMKIEVPDALRAVTLPPMMLQTLVENAIKHGLEPKPGGGTVWILARRDNGSVAVTVADDGQGFGAAGGGTGIGLKNVRERLQLVYGPRASLAVLANVPDGVAATLTVPVQQAATIPTESQP
ncbi:histidine kinase [Rhodanobacter sp. DHB23]|uniref:sensor histidine kinase n=1 Tax=Rhodanobacter sp. DHB23 TaxID=2775923 RepID=UPI0017855AD0|nr:histidine kinase [Rhodanobacter sp. DHB23]MBD8872605.1 histidine kinase [Rhodanobacter sp. DHB23]